MGRLVDIAWPELGIVVVAELADEDNPELCEEFWQDLPFKVMQAHPVVSGESLYAWTPTISTAPVRLRRRIIDCAVGDLRYSQATGNKFSIQYGKGLEPLAQPVLGKVLPEYHHLLQGVGKAIWTNLFFAKEQIFVEVKPHDPAQAYKGEGRFSNLKGVAAEFYAEAKRIQTLEPEDLRRIRTGEIGDTGTYGQYFTAWDFANGMLRDYIMYTAYPLLKLIDTLSHDDFVAAVEAFDPAYSEYLGYSGLNTLLDFSNKLRVAIRETDDKEELRTILRTFIMYGNRLCAWSYHYFPWYLGMFYGRAVNGQEFPGRFNPVKQS
ncbi:MULTISPECIES: DUF3830 family protein [unclassified Chelatococcus]|uniref:cucumopine synthase-related protein n=1 Tax=unclassified Chelatococcus TaxID=2638111 RepID=UPI001BCB2186|nr:MULTISPECIES: DUF3830 family protein [unclassified Chelatococcus]CAH1671745.1 conserved hypothetical protein [Hyphomicrobiales bacterium]MBS7738501.1 DUF3830 family protein [Chelatococcus sp. HY11]MBX3542905.1 DUF3830 family protein [Chelatococcus sp.]MCO5076969.1 DUF3830 family protein [Chelatococcus sp.]CAH1676046.1 conserved hypothetical protein [Hyphomicrobiales bacterium]